MKRAGRLLLSIALLFGIAGGAPGEGPPPPALVYLDHAITLLQQNSMDRGKVDWPVVRATALRSAQGAATTADTYSAIWYVIQALRDKHTSLVRPSAAELSEGTSTEVPTARLLGDGIALFAIPGIRMDPAGERRYVDAGVAAVREMDKAAPCGWIVDLRHEDGGDMWPGIAVLAPLLGDGTLGFFVAPDGGRTEWTLRAGIGFSGGAVMTAEANTARLAQPEPPLAVLTSGKTGSAGEALLIAFRGLSRARTFGRPTAGFATGNIPFRLSDGAVLVVTTVRDADRTGRVYDNVPIQPDEPVATDDRAVDSALAWLRTQPGCRA